MFPEWWHDGEVNIRRILAVALIAISLLIGGGMVGPGFVGATKALATTPVDSQPPTTENDFMNLERDVTSCISSNPLPGCGREPTSPSDRGGWQQLLLFGIMFLGMAVIFYRVYLSIRARDKNMV